MAKRIDHTGKRYQMMLVIGLAGRKGDKSYWEYVCDCGTVKSIETSKLFTQISCGCQKVIKISKTKGTHRMSKTRFYQIWNDMVMRCHNPQRDSYRRYGGRGISVCKRWRTFDNFYVDMHQTYNNGLTLERRDVNGNYNKDNCEWIEKKLQALNRRNTIRIEIEGVTKSVKDWSVVSQTPENTIYKRLKNGWDHKSAVYSPTRSELKELISEYSTKVKHLKNKLKWTGNL